MFPQRKEKVMTKFLKRLNDTAEKIHDIRETDNTYSENERKK